MNWEISPTVLWACLGLGLIIFEVFTTTFFILFFGLAALVVSLAKVIGLNHLETEIIIFAVIGMAGTLVFRKKIVSSFNNSKPVKIDQGKTIEVTEKIGSNQTGSIVYRGAPWKARNNSEYDLNPGDNAIIEEIDGITLVLNQK